MADVAPVSPAPATFLGKLEAEFKSLEASVASHLKTVATDAPEVAAVVEADLKAGLAFLESSPALVATIGSFAAAAGGPVAAQTWAAIAAVLSALAKAGDAIPTK